METFKLPGFGRYTFDSEGNCTNDLSGTPHLYMYDITEREYFSLINDKGVKEKVMQSDVIAHAKTLQKSKGIQKGASSKLPEHLTDDQVRDIRKRMAAGEKTSLIAKEYQRLPDTIRKVARRKAYEHVKDTPDE